jgi:urease accessory protein
VLLRVLAPQVESALRLLKTVRAAWRTQAWGLPANEPRVWQS